MPDTLVRTEQDAMVNAIARVVSAWEQPGRSPEFHEMMKIKLLAEWPTLAEAVMGLATEVRR